jgi:hypothetical protein
MISKPPEDHDVSRLNLNDVDLRNSLAEGSPLWRLTVCGVAGGRKRER